MHVKQPGNLQKSMNRKLYRFAAGKSLFHFILDKIQIRATSRPTFSQGKLRHLLGSPGMLLRFGGSACLWAGMCKSVSFYKNDPSTRYINCIGHFLVDISDITHT